MVGRAGAGALATVPGLNILHLNNVSIVITGLSTGLVTVFCTSYASLLIYAVVYGLSVGRHSRALYVVRPYSLQYVLVNEKPDGSTEYQH